MARAPAGLGPPARRWVWALALPEECPGGHAYGRGGYSLTWQACDCPGAPYGVTMPSVVECVER